MRFSLKSFFTINAASLTLSTILLVVILFHVGIPILDMIELKTYDLRFLSRGHLRPSPAVALALIDEKSLDKEGRWPWPRSKMASLVNILSQDGAKVIGFDIGFLEPDENSLLQFINQFGQKIDALDIHDTRLTDFMKENKENADNDLALAKAIRNSSSKVVLGYFFHMSQAELDYRIDQKEIDKQIERISASKYPFVLSDDPRMESFPFPRLTPLKAISRFSLRRQAPPAFSLSPLMMMEWSDGCPSSYSAAKISILPCRFPVPGFTWTSLNSWSRWLAMGPKG